MAKLLRGLGAHASNVDTHKSSSRAEASDELVNMLQHFFTVSPIGDSVNDDDDDDDDANR
jgi:hypothetical protein